MGLSNLLIVACLHIISGAVATILVNKKADRESAGRNWVKLLVYFALYILIAAAIMTDRNIFLGVWIIIATGSLIEILKVHKGSSKIFNGDLNLFIALAVFSIVALSFSLFVLLPQKLILYVWSVVVFFDGSSQIAGNIFGKHKILPLISPGKTIEGSIGGLIIALISSIFIRGLAGLSVPESLASGALICLAAFTGDMLASAYKRSVGVKDFSSVLPGQGGILDRFDSVLMAGSVTGLLGFSYIHDTGVFRSDIALFLAFSLINISILLSCEIAGKKMMIRNEYTRMVSHILIGITSLLFLLSFKSAWYAIAFCLQSMAFTLVTQFTGVLGSHHGVGRKTWGSTYFYSGILLSYLVYLWQGNKGIFIIPVSILAFSDPAAFLAGHKRKTGFWHNLTNRGINSGKTIAGSLTFLGSAFIIAFTGISLYYSWPPTRVLTVSVLIAAVTATSEAVSSKGADNLTVPASASLILIISGYLAI